MKSETALVLSALTGVVVLAIMSMQVVGRRASRTVDRVTDLLERNEARFRAMVRDSSDIMAIVDAYGQLTYASPATEKILGLDSEALVGTNAFDLIHPEDRPRVLQAFELAKSDPDLAERVEMRMIHADGGFRNIEAMSTNLLHEPAIAGLVVSARDVTDRRQAEAELREAQERFRSAFEHAPIGMALMSLDGRLFRVNRAMVQIVGRGTDDLLRRDAARPHRHQRPRGVRGGTRSPVVGRGAERAARGSVPAPRRSPGVGRAQHVDRARHERESSVLRLPARGRHAAAGEWRSARAPGHPRPAHRTAEPHVVRRPARA